VARARGGFAQGHVGAAAADAVVTGRRTRAEMTALSTTLVLGGARSGKSAFAEKLIGDCGLTGIYLATATAGDDEMKARIAHHRKQRGEGWVTVEEPLALVDVLTREAIHGRAVLVDCLTLWLSNLMLAERDADVEARRLTRLLGVLKYPVVLVSNEVGLGLVPETPLGRNFRDAQGRLNQVVAAAVPNVVFIAAGLPLWLKRSS
jgi:adenosylcobinamide kinase/adenosylcobinamide-phosphate guanylyltransferase